MSPNIRMLARAASVLLLCQCAFSADGLDAAALAAKHLESLGTAEVRSSKSRVVEGTAVYKVLVGGTGQVPGKSVFASEGAKSRILLKVNADKYHGEQFISTGAKTDVAGTYADKTRSEFGEFLRSQDAPLREGLLGGVLNTAWPLLDLGSRKASLSYDGLKSVDGRKLHAVRYKPRKPTDLSIVLYFDPETFRHVITVYTATRTSGLGSLGLEPVPGSVLSTGASETQSARRNEAHYRIEERFSDFQSVDGLTLPSVYDLRFTEELQNGFSKSVEWEVHTVNVLNNITLDPKNFEIR
jgi:hypothetical protein